LYPDLAEERQEVRLTPLIASFSDASQRMSPLPIPDAPDLEEDSLLFDNLTTSLTEESVTPPPQRSCDTAADLSVDQKQWMSSNCNNCASLITMEDYNASDFNDLVTLKVLNESNNKFSKGSCFTRQELKEIILSDKETKTPSYIMSVCTPPMTPFSDNDYLTGFSSEPTGKLVIRLRPEDPIYVTYGSVERILKNKDSTVKTWYAVPLYGGKRRRVCNVYGIYGASMNHGQVPGFKVYKVFTKAEVVSGVKVEESWDDFAEYSYTGMQPLIQIIGSSNEIIESFKNIMIDRLVTWT
jgi:hypothetical protein